MQGWKPSAHSKSEEVLALAKEGGMTRAVIAAKLGMSERSVYRVLGAR